MFRDIHFTNNGTIALIDLTTMGASSKRGDTEKIGKFDSGLKYAISILVRNRIDFAIESGGFIYEFLAVEKTDEVTSKTKNLILLRQLNVSTGDVKEIETAFAVDMGFEWELWMAIRELYSNCIDEGGEVSFNEYSGGKDTVISISGCEEIEAIIENWDNYFLNAELPLVYANNVIQIFRNPNEHLKLYKQGVLVYEETERQSKYVYNYSKASIDEMRMLNDYEDYISEIRGAINNTTSEDLILELIEDDVHEFEDDINLGSFLSNTWVDVINDYYATHGTFTTYKGLMQGFMSDSRFDVGTRSVKLDNFVWWSPRVEVTPVVEEEKVLTFEEEVKKICKDQGFIVEYPIVLSQIERIKCIGDVFKKTIYVSEGWEVWEIVKAQYKIKFDSDQDRVYRDLAELLKSSKMELIVTETPEKWVIMKLPDNVYKVFGTWAGGYLEADRWKVNSGIRLVQQDEEYYYFLGFSGSCYKCLKNGYGVATSYLLGVLEDLKKRANGRLETLEDVEDWGEVINE